MNKNYKRRKAVFQEPVLVLLRIVIKILILASNVNNASIGDRPTGNPHINCYTEQIAGNMFKNGSKFFYEYNRDGKK